MPFNCDCRREDRIAKVLTELYGIINGLKAIRMRWYAYQNEHMRRPFGKETAVY